MKEYDIDGKTFVQRPLVMGQVQQLLRCLDGIDLPESLTLASLLDALGGRLYTAIAIVITEKGCSPREKNVAELAAALEWSIDMDTALGIIDDFFELNPVSSLLGKAGKLIGRMGRSMAGPETGSTKWSSLSPAETSPGATLSSGGTRLESASPG
jgi:hypothetical protein